MNSLSRRDLLLLASSSATAAAGAAPGPSVRILFGGDVILTRGVASRMEKSGGASPLRELAPRLQAADITFVNLESPFGEQPIWPASMVFRAVPKAAKVLADAGIDVVSTANNHVRDCGPRGIEFTLEVLEKHRIAAVGTGRDENTAYSGAIVERQGLKFGFLAYTFDQNNGNYRDSDPRIAMMDIKRMQAGIGSFLKAKADAVIVSMHAGIEYNSKPFKPQIDFARAAIDAGAKLVVGHHPHVVQTFELYRDGLILYSLGNLVFDQIPPETNRGLLAEAVFQNGRLTECSLIPVDIVDTIPRVSKTRSGSTILVASAAAEARA